MELAPRLPHAEIPAANGISSAASLARIYSACVDDVDGVRLLEPATVQSASATVTPTASPTASWSSRRRSAWGS